MLHDLHIIPLFRITNPAATVEGFGQGTSQILVSVCLPPIAFIRLLMDQYGQYGFGEMIFLLSVGLTAFKWCFCVFTWTEMFF